MNRVPCHTMSKHVSQKDLHPMFAADSSLRLWQLRRFLDPSAVKWQQPLVVKKKYVFFFVAIFGVDFFEKKKNVNNNNNNNNNNNDNNDKSSAELLHYYCLRFVSFDTFPLPGWQKHKRKAVWSKYVKFILYTCICIYIYTYIYYKSTHYTYINIHIISLLFSSIVYCLLYSIHTAQLAPLCDKPKHPKNLGPHARFCKYQTKTTANCPFSGAGAHSPNIQKHSKTFRATKIWSWTYPDSRDVPIDILLALFRDRWQNSVEWLCRWYVQPKWSGASFTKPFENKHLTFFEATKQTPPYRHPMPLQWVSKRSDPQIGQCQMGSLKTQRQNRKSMSGMQQSSPKWPKM